MSDPSIKATQRDHPRSVRVGLVQHACPVATLGDPSPNIDTAESMIRDAAGQGAELIFTQELFHLPYFPQVESDAGFDPAEPIPGPTTERLGKLARALGVTLYASLYEKRMPGVFHNTSVVIDKQGAIVGRYRKMHIPDDPCFFEKYYFTPGDPRNNPSHDRGLPGEMSGGHVGDGISWQVHHGESAKVGTLICWDQWFPEAARINALRGAELIAYPTAIGYLDGESAEDHRQQRDAWQTIQRSHAIANGVFVIAINRVGTEDKLRFWGGSMVVDPFGVVLAEAPEDKPAVLVVDCDLSRIDQMRQTWPFLRDRRIDAYGELTRRVVD